MKSVCDVSAFPLIAFRQLKIYQSIAHMLQVNTQDQQGSNYSANGRISKVGLERDIAWLELNTAVSTPSGEGKEEQKETVKPVAKVEEAKEKVTVKPFPEVVGITNTTASTASVVERTKEKTTARPVPGVGEADGKRTTLALPSMKEDKEKATVKPSFGMKVAHANSTSKDKPKAEEPPASVKAIRPVTQAATVTEKKKLRAADFKTEPQWDFDDEYILDSSSPASVGMMALCICPC